MVKKGTKIQVGVFILSGILGALFLALKASNLDALSIAKFYTIRARFDNIGGLKNGASVRSAGVSVGRIKSITFDKNVYRGLVMMRINEGVQFPIDSSARIFTSGLLGEQYVDIEPGSDDKNLSNNDLIKQTQSAITLENLLGQVSSMKVGESGSRASSPAALLSSAPTSASNAGALR